MADCSRLLQQGLGLVQTAAQHDAAGNYQEAVRLYSLALDAFLSVLKSTSTPPHNLHLFHLRPSALSPSCAATCAALRCCVEGDPHGCTCCALRVRSGAQPAHSRDAEGEGGGLHEPSRGAQGSHCQTTVLLVRPPPRSRPPRLLGPGRGAHEHGRASSRAGRGEEAVGV
jgi:hypothetical protein